MTKANIILNTHHCKHISSKIKATLASETNMENASIYSCVVRINFLSANPAVTDSRALENLFLFTSVPKK